MERRSGILEWLVAGLMTALVVLVFTQVLVRYLTYQPRPGPRKPRATFSYGSASLARRSRLSAVNISSLTLLNARCRRAGFGLPPRQRRWWKRRSMPLSC